jgi:hypothetical protein
MRDYPARAGGQFIEIAVPGSKGVTLQLNTAISATINSGTLKPVATTGLWGTGGSGDEGRGAAIPRQTAGAAAKVMADLSVGDIGW